MRRFVSINFQIVSSETLIRALKCVSLTYLLQFTLSLPSETSENLTVFWCFQGVKKECIGNEWSNIQAEKAYGNCGQILMNSNYIWSLQFRLQSENKNICAIVCAFPFPLIRISHSRLSLILRVSSYLSVNRNILTKIVFRNHSLKSKLEPFAKIVKGTLT